MTFKKSSPSILVLSLLIFIHSCSSGDRKKKIPETPGFHQEILAFTSGLISKTSPITVRFANENPMEVDPAQAIKNTFFDFSPEVKGSVYWLNRQTLEFRPDQPLESGREYKVRVKISRIFPDKKAKEDFVFRVNTIPLNLNIEFAGLRTYSSTDMKWNRIEGTVNSSDIIESPVIQEIISASQNGNPLPVRWDHESGKKHHFVIDSVERRDDPQTVNVSWNSDKIKGMETEGSREYSIPSLGDFVLMDHKIVQNPDQYISLVFSDPVKSDQYLNGLISLSNGTGLRFSVNDNEIRVYPNARQSGSLELSVLPGIQNILGYKFPESKSVTINFEELKPAVRLTGNGVILPDSEGLIFPFEAVNLKAIDVKVIKIFENNIPQFLQVNRLNGEQELKRAGRLIKRKTIDLIPENPINFNEWNAFAFDLTELITPEPSAIYRIEISFRKKHSLYSCGDEEAGSGKLEEDNFEDINESELAYWDATWDTWDYNYDYQYYDWDERDDPCSDSYYNYYGRKVSRNILASNLGIIAKSATGEEWFFAVTNLLTTEPVENARLNVYNFQQQLLGSVTTNQEGTARIKTGSRPFLVIAERDQHKAYLRLDPGTSLSLSQFDISGSMAEKGVKGFIYGERGVWRPGDSLYLNFILEDKENKIPDNHPVIFELSDPSGKIKKRLSVNQGMHGFYPFHTSTLPDDPTGFWYLRVQVGGASFSKSLRVETVKPNRLKINLDFGSEKLWSESSFLSGKIAANWLHGAKAGNLRARIEVNFNSAATSFPGFKDYKFTDLTKRFSDRERVIFEGRLNSEGMANFNSAVDLKGRAPGMVDAIFTSRVFEEGGDFSIMKTRFPYSPYPVYTGVKKPKGNRYGLLSTDTLHTFNIITLSERGEPISVKNINVSVYKLQWRWWWHNQGDNLASFTAGSGNEKVFITNLNTGNDGKSNFRFTVNYPEWGRYLILVRDPSSGHSSSEIVYFDWPDWAGRSSRNDPQAAVVLPFSSDKTSYQTGETATLSIPAPENSRILLSLENGSKVIDHFWLRSEGEETRFSFTLTPEMAPTVYAHITLIQPHSRTKNDLPLRMYGVIPLSVVNPGTKLEPVIGIPQEFRPESEIEVEVSESSKKEMTYTLAIVDEGLLDLTAFQTPDPWNHFYSREALGVKTYDLYDEVLGAFGGRIDGIFSIGGDMEAEETEPGKRANRFPPMVRFLGPYHLEPGKTKKHKIQVPNYTGSVRTMLIAGQNGAYGSSEKTSAVRKPLMVISTLPRVLSPGEDIVLPVTVFAMDEKIRDVNIRMETNEFFELTQKESSVQFTETGEKTLFMNLKVKELTGIGKVSVHVSSGKEKAHYDTELEIRAPNPPVTTVDYKVLEPGSSWETNYRAPGMKGTNSGILEVSSLPPFDPGRRLKSLLRYPHGCIEQTVSAAFPQLYLPKITESGEKLNKMTSKNVEAALRRLSSFRLPSGGYGYWPGATLENDWGSSYAGHFMLEAKDQGFQISEAALDAWKSYQKKTARRWYGEKYEHEWHRRSLELSQAYRLYTLALAGDPAMGAMNRLKERKDLSNIATWYLAAAYGLAGQEEFGRELLKGVTTEVREYGHNHYYTYGSALRDQAIILEAMTIMNMRSEAVPLIREISSQLNTERWFSTQTTAFCLMALSRYLIGNENSEGLKYSLGMNASAMEKVATNKSIAHHDLAFEDQVSGKVKLTNTGNSNLFVSLSQTGVPLAGEENAMNRNLALSIRYVDMQNKPINIENLTQGTDFIAVLTISNPGVLGDYEDLALNFLIPSGWEIQNQRLFESNSLNFDIPTYEDIRDDRIYSYFDLYRGRTLTLGYKLTATYAGKYYLPGISCEAMYDDNIQALIPGKWITVSLPGE